MYFLCRSPLQLKSDYVLKHGSRLTFVGKNAFQQAFNWLVQDQTITMGQVEDSVSGTQELTASSEVVVAFSVRDLIPAIPSDSKLLYLISSFWSLGKIIIRV